MAAKIGNVALQVRERDLILLVHIVEGGFQLLARSCGSGSITLGCWEVHVNPAELGKQRRRAASRGCSLLLVIPRSTSSCGGWPSPSPRSFCFCSKYAIRLATSPAASVRSKGAAPNCQLFLRSLRLRRTAWTRQCPRLVCHRSTSSAVRARTTISSPSSVRCSLLARTVARLPLVVT